MITLTAIIVLIAAHRRLRERDWRCERATMGYLFKNTQVGIATG